VPAKLVEETRRIVVEAMETLPAGFTVPLEVDVKTGRTWAAVADVKKNWGTWRAIHHARGSLFCQPRG